jgi:cytochrome P450
VLEQDVRTLRRAYAEAREESDPFERFNRAQGMGVIVDPYPGLAAMRAAGAVHRVELAGITGTMQLPSSMLAAKTLYVALGFDVVWEVLRDAARFSSQGYAESMGKVMGHTILEMDGAEHIEHRGLISRAFSKRALERWERDLVRPAIDAYIDAFAARGTADLVRELTFPFPVRVIAGMIGMPEEDHARFHRLAVELISVSIDPEAGRRASRELRELFAPVVAARRREPRDDLISVLAHAVAENGTRLDDEQIYAFLCLLAPAGAETTYRSSSNLLVGLLSNPEQLDAVRRDPALVNQAIEEGLRWEPPLLNILRTATADTELAGVAVPKGAPVSVNLGAANRDPARWDDPDRFDLFRPQKPHIAFAIGQHVCLGQHLARMETRVLLERLFERLPNLRFDPDQPKPAITGLIFRSPPALPVRFDASGV